MTGLYGVNRVEESGATSTEARTQISPTEHLVDVAQALSMARDLATIMAIVRRAARDLTGADGATFVLREGELCFYAEENAISPLWKGRRFPIGDCISGWTMLHKESVVIEDVRNDPRIPQDVYRTTFVRSLAMVPIRASAPIGAIGNYWATVRRASAAEVKILRALADLTSVALENVQLFGELQKKIVEAQAAVQAKEEFLVVAAHELRTPLTAMLLQLQRLERLAAREDGASQQDLGGAAVRAVTAAQRFAALVNGLVDASRFSHGLMPLNVEEVDLVRVVRDVVARFDAAAKRAGSEFQVETPPSLQGRWDLLRVEQVLTNLLSNALKYGAGKPINVSVAQRGHEARVDVRDHGAGIAPEIADRIFERFGRAGPVSHHGGLGLGLYFARQVVEAHGGQIGFSSVPGHGSTFSIVLPLAAPQERGK